MGRAIFVIVVVALFVFILNPAEAARTTTADIGTIPIPVETKSYKAEQAPVLEVGHFINNAKVDIYVVTEEFGILNIESDVFLERPMQREPKSEGRDMFLDYGYQIAQYIIPTLYGVKMHEVHTGNVYIGTPSLSPDGSITMVDVKFVRDGLLYRARVGMLSTDLEANRAEDQMWFVYPYTR